MLAWLSVWSEVQMICIWSSWCHCHPIISCFIKIQNGLTFPVPAYPGCPGKEAIKRVSCRWRVDKTVLCDTVWRCRANYHYDREQDRPTRWIKEAVHIRKEGHRAMNRDEGSYQFSYAYDRFLDATADRRIKTRKNWVPAFLLMRISWWDRNIKIRYKCLIVIDEFLTVNYHVLYCMPGPWDTWNTVKKANETITTSNSRQISGEHS